MLIWLEGLVSSPMSATIGAAIAAILGLINLYVGRRIGHKFDVKLEQIKPETEAERYRRQAVLEHRFEAYYASIDCITRYLQADTWTGPDVPESRKPVGTMPTEAEVNCLYAKLKMYCGIPQIPDIFFECCKKIDAATLGAYVATLRADLKIDAQPSASGGGYQYYWRG